MNTFTKPKWQKELEVFSGIKSTFIVEGNIYDVYPMEENQQMQFVLLDEFLYGFLKKAGYETVVFYDPINGFHNRFEKIDMKSLLSPFAQNRTFDLEDKDSNDHISDDSDIIKNALMNNSQSIAFVLEYTSRYMASPDVLESNERRVFLNLLYGSLHAQQVYSENNGLRKNQLFMIAEKLNDLPAWLFIDKPFVKSIIIPNPELSERKMFSEYRCQEFFGYESESEEKKEKFKEEFVAKTDGLKCIELNGLKNLSKIEQIPIKNIQDVITLYKYGIKENPWKSIDYDRINTGVSIIESRLIGQTRAVKKSIEILKRAVVGLSGLQQASASSKPRGCFLFVGPTGTGKTLLAELLALLVFNNTESVIRFDMSEYSTSHSDQKLFGSPPGYIGYEAGGQLTNAVREKPFSIILFDEIEKAHPTILDKFLQILDAGRLTDGHGNTTYFSDAIIIFTSNLGIYVNDRNGNKVKNADISMGYDKLKEKVTKGVKDYFVDELGKPELLGRIGENNVLVFDYIRKEVAETILDIQLMRIKKHLADERQIEFELSENALDFLKDEVSKNIENGGRGIGNMVEECVINPLSTVLFDQRIENDAKVMGKEIVRDDVMITMECEVIKNGENQCGDEKRTVA